MLIKDVNSLLRLHWDDENKISHLDEIINKTKNVLINDFHKNIEKKKFYIIYENTASITLKKARIKVNFDNTNKKTWIINKYNNYK